MPDAPFGIFQLAVIQVEQQASVVVKHRSHLLNLHGIVLVKNTKIAAVAVNVKDQGIQDAHPAEGIAVPNAFKVAQEAGNGPVFGQNGCLGKAECLTGKEWALGDQCAMIEPQVVDHSIRADMGCKLGRQIF